MHRAKKSMLYLVVFLITVALGGWLFLQTAVFGSVPSGERQARIGRSPNFRDGAFQNLLPTEVMRPNASYLNWFRDNFRKSAEVEPTYLIPSVKTDLNALPDTGTVVVWFGHSSYLIHAGRVNILVDPVFSGYASPVPLFGKAFPGTNTYTSADMPPIDVLVLTHDHYDHLDYQTLLALRPTVGRVVVPLGVGAHLERWGYDPARISELDWNQAVTPAQGLTLTALPARHFSGRGIRRGQTLWAAYVLNLGPERLFLGGDSGYDPYFRAIGEQYGPFDLALLECGQYGRDWPTIHIFPAEVAQVARDLNTRVVLPVHWAKFALAFHPWRDPIRQLTEAIGPAEPFTLTTPKIGQPVPLSGTLPQVRWWENVGD